MRLSAKHDPIYECMDNYISFLVFILPWVTVGVGVTMPPLRDEVKPDEALVEKIVLLVRVGGGSTLVSM